MAHIGEYKDVSFEQTWAHLHAMLKLQDELESALFQTFDACENYVQVLKDSFPWGLAVLFLFGMSLYFLLPSTWVIISAGCFGALGAMLTNRAIETARREQERVRTEVSKLNNERIAVLQALKELEPQINTSQNS